MKSTKLLKLEKELKQTVELILQEIPFLKINKKIKSLKGNIRPDLVMQVNDGNRSTYLIIEAKSSGEPRYIRPAILQLKEYLAQYKNSYGIITAPYISSDTDDLCKKNKVGFIDLAGNCFINFGKVYIEKNNYPNPNIEKRTIRSIFSQKATRILRVMLNNPKKSWQVQELAKEAYVSIGLAFKVKDRLLDLEYAKEEKKLISLIQPQKLLNKWADNYSFRNNQLYDCFSIKVIREIEKELSLYCQKKNITYALALFSGASIVAPFSRYTRGFAYINYNIKEIMNALDLKDVNSGANFTLMQPYDEGVFYNLQKTGIFSVTSNIQLYLDLTSFKGRGEEAAKFLFEQKIKSQW